MKVLLIFLDGIGLGANDPQINPFAKAPTPHLKALLGGQALLAASAPAQTELAALVPLDANLGVAGLPQSATGQATLLTGVNVPGRLGYHYGPKPNPEVAAFVRNGNLFSQLKKLGLRSALLNAYPPRYFAAIQSGYHLYSAIPLAVTSAGLELKTHEDLYAGQALSADFTGQGWREHLGFQDAPLLEPYQAGQRLAQVAAAYDFSFFEVWLTDLVGHHQDMAAAVDVLAHFDQVVGGLLETWDPHTGLIVITSDHGNMEDLSTRRHTANPVPALVIGAPAVREAFTARLSNLANIAPAVQAFLVG